jgi:hypothetical protein
MIKLNYIFLYKVIMMMEPIKRVLLATIHVQRVTAVPMITVYHAHLRHHSSEYHLLLVINAHAVQGNLNKK